PDSVTFPCKRLLWTIRRAEAREACPAAREIRSETRFWYRRSAEVETFSSTTGSYRPGTRARTYPPFESDRLEAATAPSPAGTARIVTGRLTSGDPLSRTVPETWTGIGLRAIGTRARRPAGDEAGMA